MSGVDPSVFKAYDIRGTFPDQLDVAAARQIGRGFARVLAAERGAPSATGLRIAIGHDMRHHSPDLAESFSEGLVCEGAHVIDLGMVGTEMVYFAVGSRELDGGVSVTASHNPKQWAGFKLVRQGAIALSGDRGLGEIKDLLKDGLPEEPGGGTYKRVDAYEQFREHALSVIDPAALAPMKVVLDGGNGMAGRMIGPLLDRFPLDQQRLYFEPNGDFPGHEPNPLLEENRKLIIDAVLESGADLGIAWDGDADRCFFIDDGGEFVPGDFLTALLAQSILEKNPGATILYDVRASRAVPDTIEAAGGKALVNRVGHAFFKTRMREEDAAFGGEVSGHYYFRDFWCADSGVIPALMILELLSKRGRSMSELIESFRSKYFISGEINSTVDDPDGRMAEIADRYSDGEVSRLDGVSVDYEDWHFNVRPSNTEPLLRLNLEAFTQAAMEQRRDELLELIPQMSGDRSEHALDRAAEAGIHTLRIPTPFAVGRVNAYLIEDRPLTLIDSGPNSGRALDELQRQLGEHGHALSDIELVVITHQHIDHLGLVDIVASHSGAEVATIDKLVQFVENYADEADADDRFAREVMLRNGIAEDVVNALASVSRAFRAWGAGATVTQPLRHGQLLELRDRSLRVLHRPGHSPSDTVFWDEQRQILIAADHLIKHISSNPLITRPLGAESTDASERPQALVTYIDSLRKTRELPLEIVLSGHGEPITDHVALIDERFAFHAKRADKIHALIERRPQTGHEIAQALFGDIAVTQAYLTLSEVLGHTDILLNEQRAVEIEQDGVVRFEAT